MRLNKLGKEAKSLKPDKLTLEWRTCWAYSVTVTFHHFFLHLSIRTLPPHSYVVNNSMHFVK